MNKPPKITIIGAGLAGLSAGYRLQKRGHPVAIYEARHRPGGRAYTISMGDSYEELGGKFLEGGAVGWIAKLIEELGLKIAVHMTDFVKSYVAHGKVLPFHHLFLDGPSPTDENYQKLIALSKQAPHLGSVLDLFFAGHSELRRMAEIWILNYEGSPTENLTAEYAMISFWRLFSVHYESAMTFAKGEIPQVPFETVEGGTGRLVQALAKALEPHIYYQHPLKKIAKTQDGRIALEFNPGQRIETDYLILSLPCSTLRDVHIAPGIIPEDQKRMIDHLQYGTIAKVLMPVKLSDGPFSDFSYTPRGVTWFNRDHSVITRYFAALEGECDPFSPVGLKRMIEKDLAEIKKIYPRISFPGGTVPAILQDELMAYYSQPVGISWLDEEFSKGSYSNFSPDQYPLLKVTREEWGEQVRNVFRSIEGKIFFAGEHTSIENPAMLEGAVDSGEKAARMLLRRLSH